MAGGIRLGVFTSNDPVDTATDMIDADVAQPALNGAIAALNAQPRPNRTAIRNIVRGVFHAVAAGRDWDALDDEWIGWSLAQWTDLGLTEHARINAFIALGIIEPPSWWDQPEVIYSLLPNGPIETAFGTLKTEEDILNISEEKMKEIETVAEAGDLIVIKKSKLQNFKTATYVLAGTTALFGLTTLYQLIFG